MSTVRAAEKTGVSPQTLSLPSGPGSIEGLGESFEPQLNTGTATYGVGFSVPPGRAGWAPKLGAQYNGGSGNGIVGIGWTLRGTTSIQRQSDKGLPSYTDGDTFLSPDGEELVPLSDGTLRAENEGGFERYRFDAASNTWTCQLPDGTKLTFGSDANSRVEQTGKCLGTCTNSGETCQSDADCTRTFRWHLTESRDRNGNLIRYHYRPFAMLPAPFETLDRMVYVDRIEYGGHAEQEIAGKHVVALSYGQRPDPIIDYRSGFEVVTSLRLERIDICTAAISPAGEQAVVGDKSPCPVGGVEGGSLVRAYVLQYEDQQEGLCGGDDGKTCQAGLEGGFCLSSADCFPGVSRLVEISSVGADGVVYPDRDQQDRPHAVPPARFTYTNMVIGSGGDPWRRVLPLPPGAWRSPQTTALDLNSDGLPDIVRLDGTQPRWWENEGVGSGGSVNFTDRGVFPGPPADLATPGTQVLDLTGDGLMDLVRLVDPLTGEFEVHPGTGQGRFAAGSVTFDVGNYALFLGSQGFEGPEVTFTDLNFDKRIDVLRTVGDPFGGSQEFEVLLSHEGRLTPQPDPCDAVANFYLPDAGTSMADMNGDRMLDLVQMLDEIDHVAVRYFPSAGKGAFGRDGRCDSPGSAFDLEGGPSIGQFRANPDRFFWQDVTNDGLSDLVLVNGSGVRVWINVGGLELRSVLNVSMPEVSGIDPPAFLDLNGNGTSDVVVRDDSRAYFLDVTQPGLVPPNLLASVTNGIGQRVDIEYGASTSEYSRDKGANRPWRTRVPFPVSVVKRRVVTFGLDLDGVPGEDRYITDFRYHDGYYDGREKEFRGFGEVDVIQHGDSTSPTLVTRHRFHTGAPDGVDNDADASVDEFTSSGGAEEESLKGKPLEMRRETCAGQCSNSSDVTCSSDDACPAGETCQCNGVGEVFDHVFNRWEVRRLNASHVCAGTSVGCCSNAECSAKGLGPCEPENGSSPARLDTWSCVSGKDVHYAVNTGVRTAVIEGDSASRRDLFVSLDYDDYGNKTNERNWGVVDAPSLPPFGCVLVPGSCSSDSEQLCSTSTDCAVGFCSRRSLTDGNRTCSGDPFAFTNPAEPADQLFKTMTYTNNTDDWLLRYECENEVAGCPGCTSEADAGGTVVEAKSRQYYDGLDLCQVAKGNITLREEWLDTEDRWIERMTNQFDPFGNIIEAKDARGNRRTLEYDDKFHTYPVTERVHLDGYQNAPLPDGQAGTFSTGPYTLNMTAEYHEGFGVMTRSTSWGIDGATGPESLYRYDPFGRLIATVSPGDSLAAPTAQYEYRLADPDAADLLDRSLNSVVSHARETAGGDTVDTYAYVDGVGHKLGTKAEGDSPDEWIYTSAMGYSLRGTENRSWLQYATSSPDYEAPDQAQALVAKSYDATGRPLRTTNPPTGATGEPAGGAYTEMLYKALSADTYDENDTAGLTPGDFMTHEKDGLDRLIHVVERNHKNCGAHCGEYHTRYSYDGRGNLTRIVDSQNNQKLVEYDSLSRKTFMNDPNRGHLSWSYDDTDNVVQTVDAKGQENVFTYDAANRLLTEDYLDSNNLSPDVSYVYDYPVTNTDMGDGTSETARFTAGYPSSVYDLSGEEHTSYDERRRPEWDLKRVRDPKRPSVIVSYTTRMDYDSMDRVSSLVYPDGDGLEYLYGTRGLIGGIQGTGPAGQEIVRDVQYRPSGQIASVEYGSGALTTYDYDARQRMTNLLTMGTGWTEGQELVHFGYQFDPVSNIVAITDQRSGETIPLDSPRRNTQQFDYDGLHRLTSYVLPQGPNPGAHIDYLYDKLGNMTSATSDIDHTDKRTGLSLTNLGVMTYGGGAGSSGRVGREPGDPPGPHALTAAEGRSYPYDANGNMTDIDGMTAQWDHKDRLVAVERPGMSARYVYDYTDRRITKRVMTSSEGADYDDTTTYVNRYFELREGGQPTKYVWMGDTRVAQIEATLDSSALRVQRLSLYEGWNLLTLAVTPGDNPLRIGVEGSPIAEVYRWRQHQEPEYAPITAETSVAPGDVLWVRVEQDVEIPVVGSYAPIDQFELPYKGESTYVGWRWLEATPGEPRGPIFDGRSSSQWFFDASAEPIQRWRFLPPLGVTDIVNDYPKWLGPGSVFYFKDSPFEYPIIRALPESRIRFYHQDHLGSSSVISDMAGWLDEELAYYPYGGPRNHYENRFGVPRQAYQFAQKERDKESGLQYFEARFLATSTSSFVSADPIASSPFSSSDPQRLNAYSYAFSRPVRFVDSSGRFASTAGYTDEEWDCQCDIAEPSPDAPTPGSVFPNRAAGSATPNSSSVEGGPMAGVGAAMPLISKSVDLLPPHLKAPVKIALSITGATSDSVALADSASPSLDEPERAPGQGGVKDIRSKWETFGSAIGLGGFVAEGTGATALAELATLGSGVVGGALFGAWGGAVLSENVDSAPSTKEFLESSDVKVTPVYDTEGTHVGYTVTKR